MDRIKQHKKCICILEMIDKMTAKVLVMKAAVISEDLKPMYDRYLFHSKIERENKILFLEKCLYRLFSYYADNAIKTIK